MEADARAQTSQSLITCFLLHRHQSHLVSLWEALKMAIHIVDSYVLGVQTDTGLSVSDAIMLLSL